MRKRVLLQVRGYTSTRGFWGERPRGAESTVDDTRPDKQANVANANDQMQGRMYIFDNYVCFYSAVFGFAKKRKFMIKVGGRGGGGHGTLGGCTQDGRWQITHHSPPTRLLLMQDIVSLRKKKQLGFPNSIEVGGALAGPRPAPRLARPRAPPPTRTHTHAQDNQPHNLQSTAFELADRDCGRQKGLLHVLPVPGGRLPAHPKAHGGGQVGHRVVAHAVRAHTLPSACARPFVDTLCARLCAPAACMHVCACGCGKGAGVRFALTANGQ